MEHTTQLFALFAFGFVITGIVVLGVVRAREYEARSREVARAGSVRPHSNSAT